ncbi:LysM peptidoglycan-binding domain-containing protein [Ammonifex thiophilus]|uniref:LysM peptidoglycan-binding domain-containing protein n=1 Tax=Ammonifex thiophilus TaxID=444093 RepID=A0A3D8P2P8_9THEO|nr:LysM peptidoglycan-binding domain-containing protein [Ammonifex thiophilus]RDV82554.1 LysM peptidoglycan-binding domain-containing protein [Ammonifex thiophilus]
MRFFSRLLVGLGFLLFSALPAWAAYYTVKPGDSLYKISRQFGTTVEAIQYANSLWTTLIYPGQVLYIPDQPFTLYTVRSGDTLYFIGKRFGVPYQEIMRLNGLSSSLIYPGQVLRIPLASPVPAVSRGEISVSRSDIDLLARLITAEADGEPYIAKVAVGAVVLNRVKTPGFPKSIPGVIYQVVDGHYQFEPVLNGWINRPASPEAYRAALDALSGWDPTNGATYFYAWWANNAYLRSLPVACVLGNLIFCYGKP